MIYVIKVTQLNLGKCDTINGARFKDVKECIGMLNVEKVCRKVFLTKLCWKIVHYLKGEVIELKNLLNKFRVMFYKIESFCLHRKQLQSEFTTKVLNCH